MEQVYELFPDPKEIETLIKRVNKNSLKLQILYELYGYYLEDEEGFDPRNIIRSRKYGWSNECYCSEVSTIREQRDFIQNPPQVAEGVLSCPKCGSNKVYSQSRQSRSSDEGMNVNAKCTKCGKVWSQRG